MRWYVSNLLYTQSDFLEFLNLLAGKGIAPDRIKVGNSCIFYYNGNKL